MNIKKLTLRGWRNYEDQTVELDQRVNLLLGENAQGKTNLLEAVGYLSTGSSFRTGHQSELIGFGQEFAELSADLTAQGREQSLRVVLFASKKRRLVEQSGVKKKTWAELDGVVRTVLFSPDDLGVLRGGGAGRRRLIDQALCQLRPNYQKALMEYGRLLDRKSRIVKDWREQGDLLETLPDYNLRLAQVGALIIGYRARYLKALAELAEQFQKELSGDRESLRLEYQTVTGITDPFSDRAILQEQLLEHLQLRRTAELESGMCLVGPHRDDFSALLGELSLKSYGSQGQTRTAAIALKLSERELQRRDCGEEPILLLDDVLSELDAARQDYVLNRLGAGQVFITCCEDRRLSGLGKQFQIRDGTIECM